MGCLCSLYGRDEAGRDPAKWANDVCPTCGKPFNAGDEVVVDEDDVVYHYDCFEGPKPLFEEGAAIE